MSRLEDAKLEALKAAEKRRSAKLAELDADPFIGYKTLDDSLADYKLNSQAEVLARLLNRENIFISGPAGSGKTAIVSRFQELIDAQFHGKFEVALTASTGIAATLIGGTTIHSWAGLGIDQDPFDPKKPGGMVASRRSQMASTDVLVLDEISMLPGYLFEKLDAVLKWARRSSKPFGGIQLVLIGDFLQLPPVSRPGDTVNTNFAITTKEWKAAEITCCYMDKSHRATDKNLQYLLSAIASGKARELPTAKNLLNARMGGRERMDPEKTYTTLFTTNRNVDSFNQEELAKNPNPLVISTLERYYGSSVDIEKAIKKFGLEKEFGFKVGATVMMTANVTTETGQFVANGSIGVVQSVANGIPRVRFNNGVSMFVEKRSYSELKKVSVRNPVDGTEEFVEEPVATVKQLPLKLGYAITVHKSQGSTLNGVVCDLSKVFTSGLGYVALSRVRSLEDLIVTGWNDKAYDLDPMSRRISNYVRKQALKTREDFIARRTEYEGLLQDALVRRICWDEDESAKSKEASRNKKNLRNR